jgi:hypothetical protein
MTAKDRELLRDAGPFTASFISADGHIAIDSRVLRCSRYDEAGDRIAAAIERVLNQAAKERAA